eukprot:4392487-Pyramimonas_sp.AAC.1
MDVLGVVTGLAPPHSGVPTCGFVGYRGDRTNIFANCHLHPKCSVSAGIMRHHVPMKYMAEWLMLGEVVDRDLPMEERMAAGARHRARWVRPC